MRFEAELQSHSTLETKTNKEDFEETKKEFSVWVENFLNDYYTRKLKRDFFQDLVELKINEMVGKEGILTPEIKDLTIIFIEKLISFCRNIIFDKNYDKNKASNFYKNFHNTFLGRSPNLLDNLQIDFLQKTIVLSEINETYELRDAIDAQGEMVYELSFYSKKRIEEAVEDIKKLTISKKISAIKQLSNTAMIAYRDGSWARPAFSYVISLLREIKNSENNPIVLFVVDFELKKIENFSRSLNSFYFGRNSVNEKIFEDNDSFFEKNELSPSLDKIYYTDVSRDYGSIVCAQNLVPFALVKKPEQTQSSDSANNPLPIKNYDGFTTEKEFNPLGNDDFSHLIKILHTPEIRNYINNRLRIKIEDLLLIEQIYFLKFLATSDKETFKKLEEILRSNSIKENSNFLKSFLTMSGDSGMGEKILLLREKLPEDTAKTIFAKYVEIIDSVDKVVNVIKERFGKETDDSTIMNSIRETLLKKGSDLLIECSKLASRCNSKEECSEVGKNILERLEKSKHTAIILGSAFKSVLKEGITLNQIKDVTLESTSDKEELSLYKEEMVIIFKGNRTDYPARLLKETLDEFEKALENPEGKEFFILKDKKDILAFMRFDTLPNGNLYAGSLNSLNEIHGLAMGGALLKELLAKKSQECTIEAIVYEKNPMLNKYLTEYGFKKIGEIENYKGTGQRFYKIEITKGSLAKN